MTVTPSKPLFDDLMIDPSLFVAWSTFRPTIYRMGELAVENDGPRVFVPATFLRELRGTRDELQWIYWFFGRNELPTAPTRLDSELTSLEKANPTPDLPGVRAFEVSTEDELTYADFYRRLKQGLSRSGIHSPAVAKILLEEWVFLNRQSWITSRIRDSFDYMIEAGANCIRSGQRGFDIAVRKVLHLGSERELDAYDRTRAFGKWLAAGGAPAAALINPLTGVAVAGVAGLFLLFDPE